MAKLPRKTQKIFGENSPTNQVTTFGSIKEGSVVYSKDVADIQTAAYSEGWAAAVQDDYAPYRQDRNALDLLTTKQLAYIFLEGIPEWDAGTTYYKGGLVKEIVGTEFKLYHSLIDNNLNKPLTDTASWKMDFDSAAPFQTTGNLSQTIDTSTTKYPSNNAVKTQLDLKANNSEVLHKTGDETKSSGILTLLHDLYLQLLGDSKIIDVEYKNNSGVRKGGNRYIINDDNSYSIGCYITNAQDVINGEIKLMCNSDGSFKKTHAPAPAAGANSSEIATAGWVNSRITSVMNSGAYASKGTNWIKFTNGLIIQWGTVSIPNNSGVTFPKPFSNANYSIQAVATANIINNNQTMHVCLYTVDKIKTGMNFFYVGQYGITTNKNENYNVDWLAIGY